MNVEVLIDLVRNIVNKASELKNMHTNETDAAVNYACIFCRDVEENESMLAAASTLGSVILNTSTGPVFLVPPLQTVAGLVQLLKVRIPDSARPERGDADFTVSDFSEFKATYLSKPGFSFIKLDNAEMVELVDPSFDVRAYFSNPPLDEELGLKTGRSMLF